MTQYQYVICKNGVPDCVMPPGSGRKLAEELTKILQKGHKNTSITLVFLPVVDTRYMS